MSVRRYQDIQISDRELRDAYISNFLVGNYSSAFEIIERNPQLDRKAFVSDCINDIANILSNLQSDVFNGIQYHLDDLEENFEELIIQFINKGEWKSDVEYRQYNFVLYNGLIYMYINSNPSIGNIPTNNSYWVLIGLKGERGAGGSDLAIKSYWEANVSYKKRDLVMTPGHLWVAKQDNINQTPSAQSAYWELFTEVEKAGIESSEITPSDNYVGQIWFKMTN